MGVRRGPAGGAGVAREVERRAPELATSKWWKEERTGCSSTTTRTQGPNGGVGLFGPAAARCAGFDAADLGRGARLRAGRLHRRHRAGPIRPAGGAGSRDRRPGVLAGAAPRAGSPPRSRGRGRRAVAADLRQAAGEPPRVQPSKRRAKAATRRFPSPHRPPPLTAARGRGPGRHQAGGRRRPRVGEGAIRAVPSIWRWTTFCTTPCAAGPHLVASPGQPPPRPEDRSTGAEPPDPDYDPWAGRRDHRTWSAPAEGA